jgi:hypothetical protein
MAKKPIELMGSFNSVIGLKGSNPLRTSRSGPDLTPLARQQVPARKPGMATNPQRGPAPIPPTKGDDDGR